MVYSDYHDIQDGKRVSHPVIEYQAGSLRDDFNFGSVLFFDTKAFKAAASAERRQDFKYAGLYALRLALSRTHPLTRVGEHLYGKAEQDVRRSDVKQFDYVDPKNREAQVEMEAAVTEHLKQVGAWLKPIFKDANLEEGDFANEASVIIPVKNRMNTVGDAVRSVLKQQATFPFNCIVVDNHSTDGTTDLLRLAGGGRQAAGARDPGAPGPAHRRLLERGRPPPGVRAVCRAARQRRHLPRRAHVGRRLWTLSAARSAPW